MKIRPKNRQVSLESLAMMDIVMNMFIFFFVSFSLLYTFNPHQESKIKVSLPKGMTMAQLKGDNPLVVTVTAKNEIYITNALVTERSLNERMAGYAKDYRDKGVIVKADRQASVDYFVKVLDAAKLAGISKVSVSIELKKNE
ncbi:MAG TPA: biopolymer transporter ExbD [Spirochaetota bacterium]|nr:biopolymer transporter ExbD [Spirochaetota bacterium]HOD14162.1 biopolymer transporter ExbD [Spirochaetota bacterium]HPG49207.1 biopolymer transporter ExbD [Spirochaetota bacterium]HPN10741.1 biopolymer transporter ExbD [Spirochaetota bacterium]HQL83116.1 biopolymer transporter ExbD [Spirochaetota bacterium]